MPAEQLGWEEERRNTRRSGERSCWSNGCVKTARLPATTADGQNWLHSQRHLQSDLILISVLISLITSAFPMICPWVFYWNIKLKRFFLIVSIQYEYTLTYSRSSCLAAVVKQSHVSKTISIIDTTASLQNLQNKANLIWMNTEQGHQAKDFMLTETHTLSRKIILQFTEPDTKRRVGECVGMFYDSCKKTWN